MSFLTSSASVCFSDGFLAAAEKEQGFADPDLVLWSFLIFGLLLFLLRQFAWGPICEALDKREAGIKHDLEQAKLSAEKAREAQATYEAKLAAAAQEANQIVAAAREEAANTKSKILADAHQEAESVRQRGLADVEAARRAVVNELAQASVDHAVGLAGKLINRSLDKNAHSDLISQSVNTFAQSRS
ncbi:MAG: F0F1 ATP synthase subunit B [Planctomycetaceae bacterium]|nr:F0F1 ATP synthase subunit B [Planctomycetaceae bacterium]